MNDQSDELVQRVLNAIPKQPVPDLAPAVMERIAALPGHSQTAHEANWLERLGSWIWTPRPVALQWRPAYAFGLIAVLLAAQLASRIRENASPTTTSRQVLVQFRLDAPAAGNVQLAGNFTNWKASVAMKRTAAGVWTVVLPLEPGVHNYAFVVDGKQWVPDPMAPAVADGFGGLNSQLAVLTPDQGRSL